ncbi:MAG TPA: ATP-binding protein [Nitrospiraceae bacterium]|nr:ATP-binding protein [Nitrospiraceae bacterium]
MLVDAVTVMDFATRERTRLGLGALAGSAAALLVSFCGFRLHFNLSTAGFIDLLIVVLTALRFGFWAATGSSLAAIACLDYFFAPPILSFHIADPQNWVALGSFEITALIVCRLSAQVQSHMRQAVLQRCNVEKLYELSRSLLVLNLQDAPGPQIASLIEKAIGVAAVAIFDSAFAEVYSAGACSKEDEESARNTYFRNTNHDEPKSYKWQRVLRLGSKPIGAIVLCGIDLNPLMVDAIASLATAAFERARAFEKESRAEAARHSEQLRTTVLDGLAHAFKTPLTVILTSASGLLELRNLNPAQAELVELIDQHATELNAMTTHLLRMAKLESSEIQLRREDIAISEVIDEVLDECSAQLGKRPVHVRVANRDLVVSGDRQLLAITLTKLLTNATKYSTAGSPITICADKDDSRVVISVHNQGSVINLEERERVFERFYRSPATKHRASGSGVGLSVAKKTAEAHHGNLWVSSDTETGTTFILSLPETARRECEFVGQ